MRTICIHSEKGGTGKTTTAINLAAVLANQGKRVLLADLDPQGSASLVLLRGEPVGEPSVSHVLSGQANAVEAIRSTVIERLSVLPADSSLADVAVNLASEMGREKRLRLALESVSHDYDMAIIDTPPTRSLLSINALTAAGEVLVPVDPGLFSLAGLGQLQGVIEAIRLYLDNPGLHICGIVLTRMMKNNVAADVERQLRELFGATVLASVIPHNVKLEESHSRFLPIVAYAPKSAGAKAYISLAAEILSEEIHRTGSTADIHPATSKRAG